MKISNIITPSCLDTVFSLLANKNKSNDVKNTTKISTIEKFVNEISP